MNIKRQNWNFVGAMTKDIVCNNFSDSLTYELVHPNLDVYKDHIKRVNFEFEDNIKLTKYLIVGQSAKGTFTRHFFRLDELEVESLDESQGLVSTVSAAAMDLVKSLESTEENS